jgi:hypothetical protein
MIPAARNYNKKPAPLTRNKIRRFITGPPGLRSETAMHGRRFSVATPVPGACIAALLLYADLSDIVVGMFFGGPDCQGGGRG